VTAPSVDAEARRLADHLSVLIAAADEPPFFANVTTVTAGAGRGGTALVKVTYFGKELTAGGGYGNWYTPALSDRVLCVNVGGQLCVLGAFIGQPA
jgi:hypothetical protein